MELEEDWSVLDIVTKNIVLYKTLIMLLRVEWESIHCTITFFNALLTILTWVWTMSSY